MAPRGRSWCLRAIVVAVIVAGSSAMIKPTARAEPLPVVLAATPPCPFIMASSPQTLSTTPPPVPLSPCPGIVMSTYFGGSSSEVVTDVAVDAVGNIYITGYTNSTDFPTTPDALDPTFNGVPVEFTGSMWISIYDAFLAKFTPAGVLVFSTFFGGTSIDAARSIALDLSGNAYITGETWSTDFPVTEDAFDTSLATDADGIGADAFVAKFDPDGALLYSTFLGGQEGGEWGRALTVDSLGNAYVTGRTRSRDFPIRADFVYRGAYVDDVFVAMLNPDGTVLEYSTVIGGSDVDIAQSIAVDAWGSAYVAGWTLSPDFPVTPGAFDTSMEYPEDPWRTAFLFKLDPAATALEYSTFVGGSAGNDEIRGVVVDSAGNAYVTGVTESPEFPTTPGAFDTTLGPDAPTRQCCDTFVAKLDSSGSALRYSTFLGGKGYDEGNRILVDGAGQAYVVGATDSVDFPTSPGAYDPTYNGESWRDQDAFVAKLDPEGRTLVYSTFLGGGDDVLYVETQPDRDLCSQYCGDLGYSLALDSTGNTTVVGTTNALDFPVADGAYDPAFNGGRFDVYIVRMELIPEPNRAPVAYFEVASSTEDIGGVFANATGSADAEDATDLLEVRWDWEDDGVWDTEWSTAKTASHAYAWGGAYSIRLEVRDTGGLSANTTRQVAVTGPPVPLSAAVSASATSGVAPLTVSFAATIHGGVGPYAYLWDFGDGTTTTVANPTHTFEAPGTYTVTLTVRDSQDLSTAESIEIAVDPSVPVPLSMEISATPKTGVAPLTVSFAATIHGGVGPFTYSWDFGDGTAPSLVPSPTHTLESPGTYTVTLALRDAQALAIAESIQIVVDPPSLKPSGIEMPWWAILAAPAVIALGVGGALFLRRRARKGRPPT